MLVSLLSSVLAWLRSLVLFEPTLDLADNALILVATIKGCVITPWMFGFERTSLGVRCERAFLAFAFAVADAFSPLSWSYPRRSVIERADACSSREPGRTIPVQVYTSDGADDAAPPPLLIFFHGGGLFMGTHDGEAVIARFFAHRLRATVVSVGYRKTPEHAWPASLNDGEDVARALLAQAEPKDQSGDPRLNVPPFDRRKVLLVGMSAGGYHAIQVTRTLAP